MIRFSLAILFAVLVAASRPVATGGHHDFLAVGVLVEETVDGAPVERLVLSAPTPAALEAFDALLRTGARTAILQGSALHGGAVPAEEGAVRVKEILWYGRGTRAGRAAMSFDGDSDLGVSSGAADAARALAALTPAVTAAAARVLLETDDLRALRDALDALVESRTDIAAAEAGRIAGDRGEGTLRRMVAVGVLKRLGGADLYPDLFTALAADPDPLVAAAAKP